MIITIILLGNCFFIFFVLNNFDKIIHNPTDVITNCIWNILNYANKLKILKNKFIKYINFTYENNNDLKTNYLVLGINETKLKEYKFNDLDEWKNLIKKLESSGEKGNLEYVIQKEIDNKIYAKFIDLEYLNNKKNILDINEDEIIDNPFMMFSLCNKEDHHYDIKLNCKYFNICLKNNYINKNIIDILLKKQYNYLIKENEEISINLLNSSMVYQEYNNYKDFKKKF